VICDVGPADTTGIDNSDKPDPLLVDRGGLGGTNGGTTAAYAFLGVVSPTFHAEEIYDEFNNYIADNSYSDYFPFTIYSTLPAPYFTANGGYTIASIRPVNDYGIGGETNMGFGGVFQLNIGATKPAYSFSLFRGASPFISLAAGGDVVFETAYVNVS